MGTCFNDRAAMRVAKWEPGRAFMDHADQKLADLAHEQSTSVLNSLHKRNQRKTRS